MSRLLRSRAWSVLALLAGITSVWAGDLLWLRLACAAVLISGSRSSWCCSRSASACDMLATFWVRLSAATMLCAGVACWYLANSPHLPFLVVAGLLVVLAGLWWFCTALKDTDVVQLQARNLPGAPKEPVDPPRWPYGWGGVVDLRVSCTRLCRCHAVAASGGVLSACSARRSDVGRDCGCRMHALAGTTWRCSTSFGLTVRC